MESILEKLNVWLAMQLNKLAFSSPTLFILVQSLIGLVAGAFALNKLHIDTPEWIIPALNIFDIPSLDWLIIFVLGGVGLLLKSHTSVIVKANKNK